MFWDICVEVEGMIQQVQQKKILIAIDDVSKSPQMVKFISEYGRWLRAGYPVYFMCTGSYVPYKIGKLQIQGFSEPTTPNKIKQSYHITQKAARSRPRAAFLRGKLGRRQDFSKK